MVCIASRFLKYSIFAVWFLVSLQGHSATTLVGGFSNYFPTQVNTSATEFTVYSGKTVTTCASPSNSATCNTCGVTGLGQSALTSVAATARVCNTSEIHPELVFTISLKSDVAANYGSCSGVLTGRLTGSTNVFLDAISQPTFTSGQANQTVSFDFKWSEICKKAKSDDTCRSSFSQQIEFGFDKDCSRGSALAETGIKITFKHRYVGVSEPMSYGATPYAFEGIANYTVSPGDEKVFIKNVSGPTGNSFAVPDQQTSSAGSTSDASGMKYKSFRVFYRPVSPTPFSEITSADSSQDLQIEGTSLTEYRVTGLVNGTTYEFLGANVDQGGNVTYFADPAILLGSTIVNDVTAKPDKVFGLLDGKKCFIATAAYGSEMDPQVAMLREFRDKVLRTNPVGEALIEFYYRHSEAWAQKIANNSFARTITRGLLWPIVGFANLALQIGLLSSLVALFGFIFGLRVLGQKLKKTKPVQR